MHQLVSWTQCPRCSQYAHAVFGGGGALQLHKSVTEVLFIAGRVCISYLSHCFFRRLFVAHPGRRPVRLLCQHLHGCYLTYCQGVSGMLAQRLALFWSAFAQVFVRVIWLCSCKLATSRRDTPCSERMSCAWGGVAYAWACFRIETLTRFRPNAARQLCMDSQVTVMARP